MGSFLIGAYGGAFKAWGAVGLNMKVFALCVCAGSSASLQIYVVEWRRASRCLRAAVERQVIYGRATSRVIQAGSCKFSRWRGSMKITFPCFRDF